MLFSMFTSVSVLANALALSTEKFTQDDVLYHFGTRTFNKAHYIENIKNNVAEYLNYKCYNEGWNSYYVEEFKNAYFRFLNAFTDQSQPNRFYTDEFGSIIDRNGVFNDEDLDDYWYDNRGNRITGTEYRNLKNNKKKKYSPFLANQQVAKFFYEIGKAMLNKIDNGY